MFLSSESSEDENDPEEIRKPLSAVSDVQVLHPHDVLKMTDPAILLNKKQRKRGRPTEFEQFFMPKPKNKHSKTLKAQFGLTEAQSQEVETDIVDDKSIVKVEVKDEISEVGIIDEDMMDEEGKILSTSYTRSGRLSKYVFILSFTFALSVRYQLNCILECGVKSIEQLFYDSVFKYT